MKQRIVLEAGNGDPIPVHIAANIVDQLDGPSICVVANDLRDLENSVELIAKLRKQQEDLRAANEELSLTQKKLESDIAERKRAEAARRESEQRYRSLFESSPDAVFLMIPDGRIVAANPAACAMFGMSEEEICQVGRNGLIDPDDHRHATINEERSRTGRIINAELSYVRKNGIRFPAEVDSVILPGNPPRAFVIVRDITERKRAEEAMRSSEDKFSTIFHASPIAMSIATLPDARLHDVNQAWLDQAGIREKAAVLGKTSVELGLMSDAKLRDRLVNELQQTGAVRDAEVPARTTAGEPHLLRVNLRIVSIGGRPFLLSTNEDITALKQAEEALRYSEAQFRAFFEKSAVGALQLDEQGRLIEVNDAFCKMTGYSRVELIGRTPLEFIHPDEVQSQMILMRQFLERRTPLYDTEKRYVRKDGRIIWIHVTASLIHVHEGIPARTAGIVEDITQRKEAEEELKQLMATLEKQVEERTDELRRRAVQLQGLASQLARAEEQERRRLAHLLHDGLQQYLVAARMRLGWLGRDIGQEPAQQTVREVEDLLVQSIDQSRSLTAELSPPALYKEGLEAGLGWLSRWMQEKHDFTVHVGIQPGRFEDIGVELRVFLFQAVRELLFNAVKHAGVKNACVGIRMVEPDLAQVVVSDQGVGFDPDTLSQRPADTSSGGTSGGSFGLFSVRERLELIDGFGPRIGPRTDTHLYGINTGFYQGPCSFRCRNISGDQFALGEIRLRIANGIQYP